MKIKLSYSTLNAAIKAPHTYLAKQMGLKTMSNVFFEDGKKVHQIIQAHCCGDTPNELLASVPTFPIVEKEDFDPDTKIEFDVNDKYYMIGYVDMLDPENKRFGEIKSGRTWSASDFARSPQWKIYAMALKDYQKVYLINTPRKLELWMPETIKIFSKDLTEDDRSQAREFIDKGIYVIEHIREEVDKETEEKNKKGLTGRSRYCFYQECPWCEPSGEIA